MACVCVVGTHFGETHCQALRQADPAVRLMVCGRDERRTARIARVWRAEGYLLGLDAAVRDPRVDALTLALPHHLHRQAVGMALDAGRHVLVEKPIATTLADADAMIADAGRCGRVLMVAENMHYRPSIAAVRKRIAAGDLGEPLQMMAVTGAPRRPERSSSGVFLDCGIHYVRAMRLLLGEPVRVAAFRTPQVHPMQDEDGLLAVFSGAGGWQCQITATWAARPGKLPDIILTGSRGTFHLWPMTGYFDYYPVGGWAGFRPWIRPEWRGTRMSVGRPDSGYREEMRAFLDAIAAAGSPVRDSAAAARRDLELVLCAYRSVESGRPEEISPPPIAASL